MDKWISVKERLPKAHPSQRLGISKTVLIVEKTFDIDGAYTGTMIRLGYYITNGKDTVWIDDNSCCEDDEDGHIEVTHWMPLPELPKEV